MCSVSKIVFSFVAQVLLLLVLVACVHENRNDMKYISSVANSILAIDKQFQYRVTREDGDYRIEEYRYGAAKRNRSTMVEVSMLDDLFSNIESKLEPKNPPFPPPGPQLVVSRDGSETHYSEFPHAIEMIQLQEKLQLLLGD